HPATAIETNNPRAPLFDNRAFGSAYFHYHSGAKNHDYYLNSHSLQLLDYNTKNTRMRAESVKGLTGLTTSLNGKYIIAQQILTRSIPPNFGTSAIYRFSTSYFNDD
ncbi:MAG: hypothetical protein AAGC85_14320, partial [Bacteroidota bacterium]